MLFLVGFVAGCYFFFPYGLLASSVSTELERRTPDFVHIQDLNLNFPTTLNVTPQVRLPQLEMVLPLKIRLGLDHGGIAIHFLDQPQRRLTGRYLYFTRQLTVNVNDFPVNKIAPNQTGTIQGKMQLQIKEKPEGEFQTTLSIDKIKSSDLIPSFLQGKRLRRVRMAGTVKNSTITIKSFSVKSSELTASGTGKLRLTQPLRDSRLRIDVRVSSPFDRRIQQTKTLEEFRNLVGG